VLSDSSSITAPSLLHKHARSKGPFLRRRYPASSVIRPPPTPRLAVTLVDDVRRRDLRTVPGLPQLPGLPSLHAVLTTPVDRIRCSSVDLLARSRAGVLPCPYSLPRYADGSASTPHFRGLLELHSRYGLQSCSPTIRGLYREAPSWPVPRLRRSQATKSYRQLLGWDLPPLVIRALGAHCINLDWCTGKLVHEPMTHACGERLNSASSYVRLALTFRVADNSGATRKLNTSLLTAIYGENWVLDPAWP
jgi:hypothetical protein